MQRLDHINALGTKSIPNGIGIRGASVNFDELPSQRIGVEVQDRSLAVAVRAGAVGDGPRPAIARLQAGDHEPSLDMLVRLARNRGMECHIEITLLARELRESGVAVAPDGRSSSG